MKSAIWDKLPKVIFQRLTKLHEQEEKMQSVLFQNFLMLIYFKLQEIGHMITS